MSKRSVMFLVGAVAATTSLLVLSAGSDSPRQRAKKTTQLPSAADSSIAPPAVTGADEEDLAFEVVDLDPNQASQLARVVPRSPGGVVVTGPGPSLIAILYGYCGPESTMISGVRQGATGAVVVTISQRLGKSAEPGSPAPPTCAGIERAVGIRTKVQELGARTPVKVQVLVT